MVDLVGNVNVPDLVDSGKWMHYSHLIRLLSFGHQVRSHHKMTACLGTHTNCTAAHSRSHNFMLRARNECTTFTTYTGYTVIVSMLETNTLYLCHRQNNTVEPFNSAALKVGNFTCILLLEPFVLANSNHSEKTYEPRLLVDFENSHTNCELALLSQHRIQVLLGSVSLTVLLVTRSAGDTRSAAVHWLMSVRVCDCVDTHAVPDCSRVRCQIVPSECESYTGCLSPARLLPSCWMSPEQNSVVTSSSLQTTLLLSTITPSLLATATSSDVNDSNFGLFLV